MLIPSADIINILNLCNIKVKGVFHIGSHDCEEITFYNELGLTYDDVVWIDAFHEKVEQAKAFNIPNVYHATISDKDGDIVQFNVANNIKSSSILEFGTHLQEHPDVHVVYSIPQTTTTVNSFFRQNSLDPSCYNFWNINIQGAELLALKGSDHCIQYADAMYLEVNQSEVYKGCCQIQEVDRFLKQHGLYRVLTKMTTYGWGDAFYIRKNKKR